MPDPGSLRFGGLFNPGDSPEEFERKLQVTYTELLKVQARYMFYLNRHNMSEAEVNKLVTEGGAVSLNDIMGIMDERGEQIEAELKKKNPDMKPQDIQESVLTILSDEFGWKF